MGNINLKHQDMKFTAAAVLGYVAVNANADIFDEEFDLDELDFEDDFQELAGGKGVILRFTDSKTVRNEKEDKDEVVEVRKGKGTLIFNDPSELKVTMVWGESKDGVSGEGKWSKDAFGADKNPDKAKFTQW